MNRARLLSSWLLPCAVVALAGCSSRLPTDPGATNGAAPSAMTVIRDPQPAPPAIDPDAVPAVPAANDTQLVVRTVNGKRGSSLVVGAFKLTIPPGAFNGTAQVTMRVPDRNVSLVEFAVYPSNKGNLHKTATLTADLSSWSDASLATAQVVSWDAPTSTWVPALNAVVDASARTAVASLPTLVTTQIEN